MASAQDRLDGADESFGTDRPFQQCRMSQRLTHVGHQAGGARGAAAPFGQDNDGGIRPWRLILQSRCEFPDELLVERFFLDQKRAGAVGQERKGGARVARELARDVGALQGLGNEAAVAAKGRNNQHGQCMTSVFCHRIPVRLTFRGRQIVARP